MTLAMLLMLMLLLLLLLLLMMMMMMHEVFMRHRQNIGAPVDSPV
jgi:hypothetical protein